MDDVKPWEIKRWDITVRLASGGERNLKSQTPLIVGSHNNLTVPLVDGNAWVCYAAGTWLGFTAKPSEEKGV